MIANWLKIQGANRRAGGIRSLGLVFVLSQLVIALMAYVILHNKNEEYQFSVAEQDALPVLHQLTQTVATLGRYRGSCSAQLAFLNDVD